VTLNNFLNSDEKIKKTEDEVCEELRRYGSVKKPENILKEIPLSKKQNLLLQIRNNGFLYFSLTRVSIDKETSNLVFHSVFLSETQLRVLYERIPEVLSEFRKIKSHVQK
jgi:hypothetical protein